MTASANPTATAASTALPPCFKMATPASAASCWTLRTMACGARVGARLTCCAGALTGDTVQIHNADSNADTCVRRTKLMLLTKASGHAFDYLYTRFLQRLNQFLYCVHVAQADRVTRFHLIKLRASLSQIHTLRDHTKK